MLTGSLDFSSSQYGVTVSERMSYCVKCFDGLADQINMSDDPSNPKSVEQTLLCFCTPSQCKFLP